MTPKQRPIGTPTPLMSTKQLPHGLVPGRNREQRHNSVLRPLKAAFAGQRWCKLRRLHIPSMMLKPVVQDTITGHAFIEKRILLTFVEGVSFLRRNLVEKQPFRPTMKENS